MGVLGAALLAAVLAVSITSLTDAPPVFGDEAWVASITWSGSEGLGYEPSIAAGGGLYDGIDDYSSPRLALFPNLVGELLFPTSLFLHRVIILMTALCALGVFWYAMRRVLGAGGALIATAALASTWAFFTMSHWIRWDSMGFLFLSVVLAIFIAGPPPLRLAAIAGGIIGVGLDYSLPVASVLPGALLLCAWDADLRWRRVALLLAGTAVGAAIAMVLHFAPSFDVAQGREQTDEFLRPIGYLDTPIKEAVQQLSLDPLLDTRERFTEYEMTFGSFRVTLIAISLGLLAGILTMLRALRVPANVARIAGLCGLALVGAVLLFEDTPYVTLGDSIGPLIVAGVAVAIWLGADMLRGERTYPTEAVPGILLVGLLFGWTLTVGYPYGVYPGLAVLFSVAAVACALRSLSPDGLRTMVPAIALAAAATAGTVYVVSEIRPVAPEPALDGEVAREARAIVPEGDTVVGEWIYWWLYEDERFRANSVIWLQAWLHPGEDLRTSLNRVCPDYVLLDDIWLSRYDTPTVQRRFPNMAPTDPAERGRLMDLLRSDYRTVKRMQVDGRTLTFWRRQDPGCPVPAQPLT